ncbi:MAG: hypothetical protein FH756_08315 [Firmicutes bacterium]|nr:hypothetical protein [Bacillota bacterium]
MSYALEEISDWEDGIPYDEFGQALMPDDLYDDNERPTTDKGKAVYAREATDPYGALKFVAGSTKDFICFDYARLPGNSIVLHSSINSESLGYMDDYEYFVLHEESAAEAALAMVETALEWLAKNDVIHDQAHWGQGPYYFHQEISRVCGV